MDTASLTHWAIRHGIPPAALRDLQTILGVYPSPPQPDAIAHSETGNQQRVRLYEAGKGNILWRNNVGATQNVQGRWIRYGLANDSAKVNARFKSADLIGITQVRVTPEMVGHIIGVFTAYEIKRSGWRYTETPRNQAYLRFLELVLGKGGIARFINAPPGE